MELVILVGNIGSGKSTLARKDYPNHTYISQDDQGKEGHKVAFLEAIERREDIIVDRQNFNKAQRHFYVSTGKKAGYKIKMIVLYVDKSLCEYRVHHRDAHKTIDSSQDVRSIIEHYSKFFQQPSKDEYDELKEIKVPYYAQIQDLTHLKGRIAVFGDLHGVWDEFISLVIKIQPDHIVCVGDLNDRGPDTLKLLEFFRTDPNAYTVTGNHENKLVRWLRGNKVTPSHGLQVTIDLMKDWSTEQKLELAKWIDMLPQIIKLPDNRIVVHAGLNPHRPLEKQHFDSALYLRQHNPEKPDFANSKEFPMWYEYESDLFKHNHILFGHQVHLNETEVAKNIFALDGGAVYGGELRAYVYETDSPMFSIKKEKTKQYYDAEEKGAGNLWISHFIEKDKLVEEGFLSKSEYENLVLYNYTEKCTFDKNWTKATKSSRGTIYNKASGEIVARAFDKFFNVDEMPETYVQNLPLGLSFTVLEKVDGSLGISYKHKGQWRMATRGSFYSDQSKYATEHLIPKYNFDCVPDDATPLFEIIYPENRIIVNYGDTRELVLLSVLDKETGKDWSYDKIQELGKKLGCRVAERFSYTLEEMFKLQKEIDWQTEGWVILFENGLRVKIKGTDYLKIAKFKSHLTPLTIWEGKVDGTFVKYLHEIPEEIRGEAEELMNYLDNQLNVLKETADVAANALDFGSVKISDKEDVKRIALEIKKQPVWMQGYLFQLMRKSDRPELVLLDMLRPTANKWVDLQEKIK